MATQNGGFSDSGVPLSPPGAMSQRTDLDTQASMDLPDAGYGEQADFQEIQGGAPMAGGAVPPTGILEGSRHPELPVTDGANYGPGVGLDAIQTPDTMQADIALIASYLPALERVEKRDDTPESFRKFVRYVRGLA